MNRALRLLAVLTLFGFVAAICLEPLYPWLLWVVLAPFAVVLGGGALWLAGWLLYWAWVGDE